MEKKLEQEWLVRAELTFSHGAPQPPPRPAPHPCYGFQRGNIVFTTKPPEESSSRRTPQPYGRRCMSTCNITLDPVDGHVVPPRCHHTVTLSCEPHDAGCDVCSGGRHSPTAARRAHTFTSHFCTRVPDKTVTTKTVASQTSQIFTPPAEEKHRLQVPEKETSRNKSPGRLSRSPAKLRGKSPLLNKPSQTDSKKKQPRTVHIDVYCTGSEASGSSDGEEPSDSSRETVFESEDVRVVHTREDERLPQALCRQKRRTLSEASSSHSCLGGDNDTNISSLYPSQRSSFASGISLPSSLVTDSSAVSCVTSSCAIFSDDLYTSWKDTDIDSLRPTDLSLVRTDSFEYADSADRIRILEKERAWAREQESWRASEAAVERKHHTQQRRHQQYLKRKGSPFPHWEAGDDAEDDDSSSESSDNTASSEMAWSFSNLDDKLKQVKREDTVRRANKEVISAKKELVRKKQASKILESGSLSDSAAPSPVQQKFYIRDNIGPFGVKDPSPPRVKLETTMTKPFTSTGKKTDQLSRAEKFGTIIGTLRKPGHHVGPSKNPDCSCYNCRMYYEELGYRNRTRSLGDTPSAKERDKWRATLGNLMQQRLTEDSGSGEWDMGTPV